MTTGLNILCNNNIDSGCFNGFSFGIISCRYHGQNPGLFEGLNMMWMRNPKMKADCSRFGFQYQIQEVIIVFKTRINTLQMLGCLSVIFGKFIFKLCNPCLRYSFIYRRTLMPEKIELK